MFGVVGGDLFEDEVGFSVGDAALDGGADAGGFVWVEEVHIEADVEVVDVCCCDLEGVIDDWGDPAVIDVGHGERGGVAVSNCGSFCWVEVSEADPDDV